MSRTSLDLNLDALRAAFGDRLQENVPLANYTTARVGGPVDALLPVHSADELAQAVERFWELGAPFFILGGGSNVLVSDRGVHRVVILNRARNTRIDVRVEPPTAWAESGANFSALARQASLRGLSGLEWAAAIPGTIGGAVYGNAGAYGADTHSSLILAEILHPVTGREQWPVERLQYQYRSSLLKRDPIGAVILSATLRLAQSTKEEVQTRMENNTHHRRSTQPAGATMGSMFKNPPGDHAGRLIEAAGLKGTRTGSAQISPLHANFFVNLGEASANDIWALISTAREAVAKKFGVNLELEIELLGEFAE